MGDDRLIEWVNQKMGERGWGPSQLAKEAGVNQSNVSKALNGKRKSGLDFWVKLADAFGPGEAYNMLVAAGVLLPAESAGDDLCRAIRSLPIDQQRAIESYVTFLTRQNAEKKIRNDLD